MLAVAELGSLTTTPREAVAITLQGVTAGRVDAPAAVALVIAEADHTLAAIAQGEARHIACILVAADTVAAYGVKALSVLSAHGVITPVCISFGVQRAAFAARCVDADTASTLVVISALFAVATMDL